MISARGSAFAPTLAQRAQFQKNFRFGLENSFWHDLSSGSAFAPIFSQRAQFQKKLTFGLENSFWHDLSSGSAFAAILPESPISKKFHIPPGKVILAYLSSGSALAAIFSQRAQFQKNFRFGLENSFWHDLSSGSAFAAIFSQRAQFEKKFHIRPGKFILA